MRKPSTKKSKNSCIICGKKASDMFGDKACSLSCFEKVTQLNTIVIPKLFIRKVLFYTKKENIAKELMQFASRHSYNYNLVVHKYEIEAKKLMTQAEQFKLSASAA